MAEDTVHDVFLKLWINREKLLAIDSFEAYLYTMSRNHAFNGLRKMATETLVLAELRHRETLLPEEPGTVLGRKEVREFIRQAVDQLTPKQREVFLLSREMGLKQEEIAERLGISVSTVKSHLTDALHFLRTAINARYGSYAVILLILLGY